LGRRKSKFRQWLNKEGSAYAFLSAYGLMFTIFIVVPVLVAIFLSFTFFDTIQAPTFIGLKNYIALLTADDIFMRYVLPNTIKFAVLVGPGGYVLSFMLAWMLAQLPKLPRTIFALILYSPSMTTGVAMAVVWKTLFSGDQNGYLNSFLLGLNVIQEPVQWLQSPEYLMTIMVVVTLWSSMAWASWRCWPVFWRSTRSCTRWAAWTASATASRKSFTSPFRR
jgi:multiple sugar transport system permease protein